MHIYELKGSTLTRDLQLTHLGPVTDVRYSPDDQYLVACDANRKVILYSVPEYKVNIQNNTLLVLNIVPITSIFLASLLIAVGEFLVFAVPLLTLYICSLPMIKNGVSTTPG